MGFDMYLYAEKFFMYKDYKTDKLNDDFIQIKHLMKANDLIDDDNCPTAKIRVEIAYWRKANAIHQFFIKECANGEDGCQDIWVGKEDLQKLLSLCTEVINSSDKAEELLPTKSGFFFGCTEYNDVYLSVLKRTQKILSKIIHNAPEDWNFVYRASW